MRRKIYSPAARAFVLIFPGCRRRACTAARAPAFTAPPLAGHLMVNVTTSTATPAPSYSTAPASTNVAAMAMVTTLFFFWGFVTVLNDILVPHLKTIFDLNYAKVMLIQFAFFSAYFIFSIPSARLVDAIGYKKTMVTGLLTMGVGALLFIPAASAASFPLFLVALMTLAAGITALQVAG